MHDSNDRPAVMVRTMECVTAALIFFLGSVVIYDQLRLGYGWGEEGPQPGYFPFRVGVILCVSSALIIFFALKNKAAATKSFVTREALGTVMKVLIPTIVYVILVGLKTDSFGITSQAQYVFGLYLASMLFIAYFMIVIGKYGIPKVLAISIGVPAVFFWLFEDRFGIPLPKGLLEAALGLL